MSLHIKEELILVLVSSYAGLVFAFAYDVMRIFRRVFKASIYRSIIEDVIFWTVASIYMFNMLIKYNQGVPRLYSVLITIIVMFLYEWLVGKRLVNKFSPIIKKSVIFLLKPLKKTVKMFKIEKRRKKKVFRNKVKRCQKKEVPPKDLML